MRLIKGFLAVLLSLIVLLTQGILGPAPVAFAASPSLVSAETSTDGTKVFLAFDVNLGDTIGSHPYFDVEVNGTRDNVTRSETNQTDPRIVQLQLQVPITAGQTVTVSYTGNTVRTAPPDLTPLSPFYNRSVINQVVAPPPTFVSAATSTDGTKVLVTFNKPMANPAGKGAEFAALVNGSADAVTAAGLNANPAIIELTLSTTVTAGQTVTLSYTVGTVTAADTGVLASFTAQPVTNNVPAPPTVSFASTTSDGSKLMIQFSKTMADPSGKHTQFTVMVQGAPNPVTMAAWGANSKVIELTLTTPAKAAQSVSVSYTAGTVTSADGAALASFANQYVQNNATATAPTFVSATTSSDGTRVLATFSKDMHNPNSAQWSQFSILVGGAADPITYSTVANATIDFTLQTAVNGGQTVTIGYTQGDFTALDGGILASFGPGAVTNAVAVPALAVSSATIPEAAANDGSITATQDVTLTNGTFALDLSTGVTVNNLPAGLSISVTRLSGTQLRIAFNGRATNHANANDITNASVTVAQAKITGAAGPVTSGTFSFDFNDPTPLTLTSVNPASGSANGGTIVTIAGNGFAAGAVVAFGGVAATNVTWVNAQTLYATTPAGAAGAVDATVTNPDAQTRTLAGGFTYQSSDTTAPLFLTATVNGASLTLTYNESLDGTSTPANTDFLVKVEGATATVTNVALNGSTATLTLAAAVTRSDTVLVSYTPGANPIRDSAINAVAALTDRAVTNQTPDGVAPTIVSTNPPAGATQIPIDPATVIITFSEKVKAKSPAFDSISMSDGSNNVYSSPSIIDLAGNPAEAGTRLKLSPPSGFGPNITYTVTIPAGAVADLADNLQRSGYSFSFSTVDTTAPIPRTANPTDPASDEQNVPVNKTVAVTFSEPVVEGSAYGNIAMAETNNPGNSVAVTTSISGSTLTIDPVADLKPGTWYRVTIPAGAVRDAAGNALAIPKIFDFQTAGTAPDTTPPSLQTATVTGATLVLAYNENLDTASKPASGVFAVKVQGADRAVTAVDVSGWSVTLTLASPVTSPDTVTLSYTVPGSNPIRDPAGNSAASLTDRVVINNTAGDTTPPTLASTLPTANASNVSVSQAVYLTFSEPVQPGSAFGNLKLKDASMNPVAATPSISGSVVTLAPQAPLSYNAQYYVDIPVYAVKDAAGNELGSPSSIGFTTVAAGDTTAPGFLNATVNGAVLVLNYDEVLAGSWVPPTAFTVSVNGGPTAVTNAALSGSTVTLTLAVPVISTDNVIVSYAVPGISPLQDAVGNLCAPLTSAAVTNQTPPDSSPPVVTLISGGADLTITTAERDGSDPALKTIHASSNKAGTLYLVNTTVTLDGNDATKIATIEVVISQHLAVKVVEEANAATGLLVNEVLIPGSYKVYAADGTGRLSVGSADVTVEARSMSITVDLTGNDADQVYFDGDTLSLTISGLTVPDGTPVRVALGILTGPSRFDTSTPVLQGMMGTGSYYYLTSVVNGGTATVSGAVYNPGNRALLPGVIGVTIHSSDGSRTYTSSPVPLTATGGRQALIGLSIPAGDIAVSPALETFTDLYNTEKPITFTRSGFGSITFGTGLDIITGRNELQALQAGIDLNFKDNALSGGVATNSLIFLANKGATISFTGAMAELGLSGVTSSNFRDYIGIAVLDNSGAPVPAEQIGAYLDLNRMTYDSSTDTLALPVNHFTTYRVSSSARSITGFRFEALGVAGNIDESARTIKVTVPHGTDVRALVPTIVHTGSSISPASGAVRDFTDPVTYTVAATGGSTRAYTVTVIREETQPTNPPPQTVVEDRQADITNHAQVEKTAEADGTTTASVTVKTAAVEKVLSAGEAVKEIVLTIKETTENRVAAVSADAFTKMAERQASLVVKTSQVDLIIPAEIVKVDQLSQQLGVKAQDVRIEVKIQQVAPQKAQELTAKAGETGADLKPVAGVLEFHLEAKAGGKTISITSFGETTVRGEFPYGAEAEKIVQDPEKLNVYKYDESKNQWVYVRSKVDAESKKVTFYTNTFSNYTLMEYNKTFHDIRTHWARKDVELMASKYVVRGSTPELFAPENPVTRAEFIAMLARALGLAEYRQAAGRFKDVAGEAWYHGYVEAAARAGLVNGRGDGTFGPNDPITREQVAAMIARGVKAGGKTGGKGGALSTAQVDSILAAFSDRDRVSAWATGDLAVAIKEGILRGQTATVLAPRAGASRAEAAAMIARFWRK